MGVLFIANILSTDLATIVRTRYLSAPLPIDQLAGVHVLSFATDGAHPILQLLISTSPYPIEVLGKHQAWRGLRHKFEAVHAYLVEKHLEKSEDIILFVDGYDTLFTPGKQDLIKKFKAFDKPLVISAENHCSHHSICTEAIASYPRSPVDTPFKYVNSGTYIGYASAVYTMLDEVLKDYPTEEHDQWMLHDYFIKHPERATLDYQQVIFSLLYGTDFKDYVYDTKQGRLINLLTQSQPIILHGNGGPGLLLKLHQYYMGTQPGWLLHWVYNTDLRIRISILWLLSNVSLRANSIWTSFGGRDSEWLIGIAAKTSALQGLIQQYLF